MTDLTPVCTTAWWCLYQFQTFFAGILALIAAVITAAVIRWAASAPIEAQRQDNAVLLERRRRHECLVLSLEFQMLHRRANQVPGIVRTHVAGNRDVSEATKERMYLTPPAAIRDWTVMSLLPPDIVGRCLALAQRMEDHNYDIRRTAGAFGADNFRQVLIERNRQIIREAAALRNALQHEAQQVPGD